METISFADELNRSLSPIFVLWLMCAVILLMFLLKGLCVRKTVAFLLSASIPVIGLVSCVAVERRDAALQVVAVRVGDKSIELIHADGHKTSIDKREQQLQLFVGFPREKNYCNVQIRSSEKVIARTANLRGIERCKNQRDRLSSLLSSSRT